jgi:metal-responsive CopG/Arc/MetJ family transcriptional regulator
MATRPSPLSGRSRTTLDLPRDLAERMQRLIDNGAARSRNALIVAALEAYVRAIERRAIDAQFEGLATDLDYRQLMLQVEAEFAQSDWEAWQQGEAAYATR